MNVNELFSKVANYLKPVAILFFIIETSLLLLVGGFLGAILEQSPYSEVLEILLIPLGLLLLLLLGTRAYHQITFPAAAIEELRSRYELDGVKKDIARKRTIDGYIDTVIKSLNQNTCSLSQEGMDELCEQDIKDGLRSVIEPIIDLPQQILDCGSLAFTVGVFLRYTVITSIDQKPEMVDAANIFVLRDNLNLGQFLSRDLMYEQDVTEPKFDLQKALQWTDNHNRFLENSFSYDGNDYTIITSPVPPVCEGDWPIGVLFIVTEKLDSLPGDLEGILLIFNRILANWLSKYDDCNRNRLQAARIAEPQDADVQSDVTDDWD